MQPSAGLVWVFSGHGSQWQGMGRQLLSDSAFAEIIDTLDPIFAEEAGFRIRHVLASGNCERVDHIQMAIFAVQMGLAALWRSYEVVPAAVIGHSVGEIGAAVVAGAMTLQDGAKLICRRSQLLQRVAGKGAMALVTLAFEETEKRLTDCDGVVAAISASPMSTVIAGEPAAVDALVRDWPSQGIGVRQVSSDVAFHSPAMDPLLDDLRRAASDLSSRAPDIPMYQTAVADPRQNLLVDGNYWAANLRNPVRLSDAVKAAAEDGYREFLEVSPHPVVAHSVRETLASCGVEDGFVGVTTNRHHPEKLAFLTNLAMLHCHGIAVDWSRLTSGRCLSALPTNPWEGHRHWHNSDAAAALLLRRHDADTHTLLGTRETIAGSSVNVWRTSLDDRSRPYPGSHALNGVEIVPAAVFVETFRQASCPIPSKLTGVTIRHPLVTAIRREIQVVQESSVMRLASRAPAGSVRPEPPWLVHAEATHASDGKPTELPASLDDPDEHRLLPVDPALIRQRLAAVGVPHSAFDWTVEELLNGIGMLQAQVRTGHHGLVTWAPALDAVLSVAPSVFPGAAVPRMVAHIEEAIIVGDPPDTIRVRIVLADAANDAVDALVADPEGRIVACLHGIKYPVVHQAAATEDRPDASIVTNRFDVESIGTLIPDQQRAIVLGEVAAQVATEMRLPATNLNPHRPLLEQGLDSVMTIVIKQRLESRFNRRFETTVFWENPTLVTITDHILEVL